MPTSCHLLGKVAAIGGFGSISDRVCRFGRARPTCAFGPGVILEAGRVILEACMVILEACRVILEACTCTQVPRPVAFKLKNEIKIMPETFNQNTLYVLFLRRTLFIFCLLWTVR